MQRDNVKVNVGLNIPVVGQIAHPSPRTM